MSYNRNKKIVLRFLKDLGLLQAWRIYINNSRYYKETVLMQRKWYEEKYIDRIFGNSDFTRFLRAKYSVYLNSTIADSGPMMVNYSFAIGTPVVSFPVGIAMDLIVHKKTGYIADYKNSTNLANGIIYLHSLSQEDRIQMSKECIKKIKHESQYGGWVKFFCS